MKRKTIFLSLSVLMIVAVAILGYLTYQRHQIAKARIRVEQDVELYMDKKNWAKTIFTKSNKRIEIKKLRHLFQK
ncbi:hypothetical protein MFLO_04620 [Listeria floridensis FSL S10-1187]|uniref:Uncharacterized protein n=1 Tax=Listeria floridensis FSL S10-1187 TaxID=1265817 RepID=A0ABN0RH05_9LIST|nr:hypothetical protein MFLO_04620 [Listeria floridensis FSL S10-1187]